MALIAVAGGADGVAWPRDKLADFRHEALGLAPKSFPVEGASALGAAEGFLAFCLAYADAGLPTRREVLAPAVAAAAKALDGLLHEDARALAARRWLSVDN